MVTNDDGWPYLRYYKQARVLTRGTPTRNDYVFIVKANLSIAPVRPEDAGNILGRMIRACSGCPNSKKNGPAYAYATEDEVKKWLGG